MKDTSYKWIIDDNKLKPFAKSIIPTQTFYRCSVLSHDEK